ncbi:MAG: hypothetical protein PHZ09_12065 [Eubacteriales bacterium]|nr:hypothetical protein [Eubacteriales bacterium]
MCFIKNRPGLKIYSYFLRRAGKTVWFIEENRQLCRVDEEGVWHCIPEKQHRRGGIPER